MADAGLKVFVEGEAAFKKSLDDIGSSLKVSQSALALVSEEYGKNDTSMKAAKEQAKAYGDVMAQQKEKISLLEGQLGKLDDAYKDGKISAEAYKAQHDKLTIDLNKTKTALTKNENAVGELNTASNKAKNVVREFGEKIADTIKPSNLAKIALDALSGAASAVGTGLKASFAAIGTMTAAATAATTAAVKGLTDMTVGAAAYADNMLTLSVQTGVSTDTLQEYSYAADLVDVSLDTLTGSMAKQIKSMSSARDGVSETAVDAGKLAAAQTKAANAALSVQSAQIKYNDAVAKSGEGSSAAQQAAINLEKAQNNLAQAQSEVLDASVAQEGEGNAMAKAYDALGVSVTDASGNLRDGQTVYWETIDALGKVADDTERDALAMQIFGKSAQELNPLIAQGSEGIAKLSEEAKNAGAVMSGDTLSAFGAFDDNVQRLTQGAGAAKNALGAVLLPQLTELSGAGVDMLGQFTTALNGAGGDLSQIGDAIGDIIGQAVDVITGMLPNFVDAGFSIVSSLAGALMDNLDTIIGAASDLVTSIVTSISNNIDDITSGALTIIMALVDGIVDNLGPLLEAAVQCIGQLALGIADALPDLIPTIIDLVLYIADILIDNVDQLVDGAIAIMVGLADGLIDAMPELIKKAPDIIIGLGESLVKNVGKLMSASWEIMSSLGKAIVDPENLKELSDGAGKIMDSLGQWLSDGLDKIKEVGWNIVSGLWNGITEKATELWDNVTGFAGGVIDKVKGVFGIHSPSKVFAEIGEYVVQGLANGITGSADVAYSAISDLARTMLTKFDAAMNEYTTSAGGLSYYTSGTPTADQLAAIAADAAETMRRQDEEIVKNYQQIIEDWESGKAYYMLDLAGTQAASQNKAALEKQYKLAVAYSNGWYGASGYSAPQVDPIQAAADYAARLAEDKLKAQYGYGGMKTDGSWMDYKARADAANSEGRFGGDITVNQTINVTGDQSAYNTARESVGLLKRALA